MFDGAKFGDRYECRNGQKAIFLWTDSCGTASMLMCDEIHEGYISYYEPDGTADCEEDYDIVKRLEI